ncbi:hypothetical protein GCM10010377_18210 [Streptomyces viridiviolaceus]|uniref:CHAT domain-containing protein n=1 Tax=Streptomyces viridiviolaceus TaxID=68282 RepID=A0ABW2DXA5_9ACTN|nr:CHAT domain-containing protein [Streptomyces viridiviolaceus]GHB28371.1 hypothetical protein GCM10010377_18210 [Streptomyces viridiviolaceus]
MDGRLYRPITDFVLRLERSGLPSPDVKPGYVPVLVEATDPEGRVWRSDGHQPVCTDARQRERGANWPARDGKSLLPEGPVRDAFHNSVARADASGLLLRVCLEVTDPDLADIPWEQALVPERQDGTPVIRPGPGVLARYRGILPVRRVAGLPARLNDPHPDDLTGALVLGSALQVRGELVCPDGRKETIEPLVGADADASVAGEPLVTRTRHPVRPLEYPLTASALRSALRAPAWCFAFQGHGLRDGLVLAGPDGVTPEFVGAGELAEALTGAGVAVVLLLACRTAAPGHGSVDPSLAEALARGGVPYVIAMRTPVRNIDAHRMARNFFEELAASGSVDRAVISIREQTAADEWLPSVYVAAQSPRHLPIPPPPLPAPQLTGLTAYHVPADWDPDEPRPLVGDGHPARIDVLWGLDRGPLRGVLVDPAPDGDARLAALLTHVEEYVLREEPDWVLEGVLPTRRWFVVRPDWRDPPGDATHLAHSLTDHRQLEWYLEAGPGAPDADDPGYGRRVGLVLPYDPASGRDRDDVAAFSRRLALAFPGAALIVRVQGRLAGSDLDRIKDLVDDLALARPSVACLSRVVPGRLPMGVPAVPADAEERHRAEGSGGSVRASWRTEAEKLLAQARSLPPQEFERALAGAARDDDTAVRAAALVVASARYAELDVVRNAWRDAWPPHPGRLGLREHGDAIVPGLLRSRSTDAAAVLRTWGRLVPDEVAMAAGHLMTVTAGKTESAAGDTAALAHLRDCDTPARATAALRCGIGRELPLRALVAPPADGPAFPLRHPAVWALLARSPLTPDAVGLLRGWPPALRRVLGFDTDRENDPEVRDHLEPLQRILHPRIPRR